MLYIHHMTCLSPQQTFPEQRLDELRLSVDNQLRVREASYPMIPPALLRRMGKAVRLGIGAALPLLQEGPVAGIILGTGNGGMEDCIKFLEQMTEFDEGLLTPGNFVQSTPNAIAAQIGLLSTNHGYNITHVHRGLSWEHALIDAWMMAFENPQQEFLVGAVDEISSYNFNLDFLAGWYKKESIYNDRLFMGDSPGSLAGEGAAMFRVSGDPRNSSAVLRAIRTTQGATPDQLSIQIREFLRESLSGDPVDLLVSGENGDNRLLSFYESAERASGAKAIVRYKQLCGEYPTASAMGLWLGCLALDPEQILPAHLFKAGPKPENCRNILLYNTYQGLQHGFMLLSRTGL